MLKNYIKKAHTSDSNIKPPPAAWLLFPLNINCSSVLLRRNCDCLAMLREQQPLQILCLNKALA